MLASSVRAQTSRQMSFTELNELRVGFACAHIASSLHRLPPDDDQQIVLFIPYPTPPPLSTPIAPLPSLLPLPPGPYDRLAFAPQLPISMHTTILTSTTGCRLRDSLKSEAEG